MPDNTIPPFLVPKEPNQGFPDFLVPRDAGPTVEAASELPDRELTPDEFGSFVKTGQLPPDITKAGALRRMSKARREKALRTMPTALIDKASLAERYGVDPSKLTPSELDEAWNLYQSRVVGSNPSLTERVLSAAAQTTPSGAVLGAGGDIGPNKTVMQSVRSGVARFPEQLLRGAFQLGEHVTEGVLGAADRAFGGGGDLNLGSAASDLKARIEEEAYRKRTSAHPYAAFTGEFASGAVIPMGEGVPFLGSAGKLKSLAKIAAQGGASAAMMPVEGEDFAATKAKQILGGAIIAPAFQVPIELGVAGATKFGAAKKLTKLPSEYRAADKIIREQGFTPDAAALMETSQGFIPSITQTVSESPIKNLNPINLANRKVATAKIEDLQRAYRLSASNQEFEWLPFVKEVASSDLPQKKQARKILEKVDSYRGNSDAAAQLDIEGRSFFNEFKPGGSRELFDQAAALAPQDRIDTSSIVSDIGAQLERADYLGADAEGGIKSYLSRLQEDFDPPAASGKQPKVTTYSDLLERSRLLSEQRDAIFTGSSELKSRLSSNMLTDIGRSYDKVLEAVEKNIGTQAFRDASAAARSAHKTGVAPAKTHEMLSMLALTPDDFVKKFTAMTPDSKAHTLKAMGEAGRKTLLAKEFDDIAKASLDPKAQFAGEAFSRDAFLTKINERMDHLKVLGLDSEVAQLEGFAKVVRRLQLMADTAPIAPGTGRFRYNLVPALMFRNMLVTPSGQRALLTLSRSRSGSKAEQFVLHAIERKVPKLMSMIQPEEIGAPGGGENPVYSVPFTKDDVEQ